MALYFIITMFSRGYVWGRDKPQAIGYGVIIFILGVTGLPDFLIQILGITIITSGLRASWDYIRSRETGP